MKLQDIFEADEAPKKRTRQPKQELPPYPGPIDAKGNWSIGHGDRRPGFKKLEAGNDEARKAISGPWREQVFTEIGSVVDQLKAQYADFKHDAKRYNQHANGRWTVYVPVDAAESVKQILMSTLSRISGKATPDFEGYPKMGNHWESVDFHYVYQGVNATVSMQWADFRERVSRAEHLNFPAFRVFAVDATLGAGFSSVTYRDHPGQGQ